MGYFISITDQDGLILDRFRIDGLDLRKRADRDALVERVEFGMGGNAVAACADLPETSLYDSDL